MSISKLSEKINSISYEVTHIDKKILIILILVLSSILSFALGRLSAQTGESSRTVYVEDAHNESMPASAYAELQGQNGEVSEGVVVGSKNGSKYHLPWCSGAQRIKEENLVVFNSIQAAQAAGYSKAANCPGLE